MKSGTFWGRARKTVEENTCNAKLMIKLSRRMCILDYVEHKGPCLLFSIVVMKLLAIFYYIPGKSDKYVQHPI